MAGLGGLLNTARDALQVQSYALNVTGQNISNANTPLYARREAIIQTRALGSQSTGTVVAVGVRQALDTFADRRMFADSGSFSATSQHLSELERIESAFNDLSGTGLGETLDAVFSSFQQLAAQPNDTSARLEVLERVGALASRARSTADALATQRADVLERVQDTVREANTRANEIAKLNQEIIRAQQAGSDASDLIDQRNAKLLNLSQVIDIRTIPTEYGGVVVQSAGISLVEGNFARELSVDLDPEGKIQIFASRAGGAEPDTNITKGLTGGSLAGMIEARDVDLFDVSQRFDRFVFDVATAINSQHQMGVGLDGEGGRNVFDIGSDPEGAGRAIRVSVDIFDNPDAIAAAGDVFELPGGSSNAVLLGALASQPVGDAGRTPTESYSDIVGRVASRTAAVRADAELRESVFQQSEALRESLSGVSLDEEMVSLQRYQRAYEAAARVLSVVDELYQELLSRVGR